MSRLIGRLLPALVLAILGFRAEGQAQQTSPANVVRIQYERGPYEYGRPFGAAGPYERIAGVFRVEVDPSHPGYREIVDIDKAPRNAAGRVEYEAEFYVLRPVDPAKANGTLLALAPNRGNTAGTGSSFLRRGFTILNVAWQGDVLPVTGRLLFKTPVATDGGRPITGRVRVNYLPENPFIYTLQLGDSPHSGGGARQFGIHDGYDAVSTDNTHAVLTMRERYWDERITIPRSEWMFAFCPNGTRWGQSPATVVPSPKHFCVPAGLRPGWIYELIYEAKNPRVMGLGLASTRDAIAFLRYEAADRDGTPNPLFVSGESMVKRVIVGGSSQSGRYIRQFLHLGFHADLRGRPLVEGLWANVAGGRSPINFRFASPYAAFLQHHEEDFPSYEFPSAYNIQQDPYSTKVDGILGRCQRMNNCPKLFHTVTSSEYWNERGSLVHTDPLGKADLELPAYVRAYLFSSTTHNRPADRPMIEKMHGLAPLHKELTNGIPFGEHNDALVVALHEWIRDGTEPPPSSYPRIADGTLVPADRTRVGFPSIPGVEFPARPNEYWAYDYGPEFETKGIITNHPPKRGGKYVVLVPKVDADGIDVAGIRPIAMAVPLGTFTGWSLRSRFAGAENELWRLRGIYVPFARTRAERLAKGDPRLSLEERYGSHDGYVSRVRAAAAELVQKRLLLADDAAQLVTEAERSDVLR